MPVKRPFCKVCHDAGKPESEYTSHWVKDLTGKTTCPTLLNTECRYCYKLGHTTKFCDVLAKNNKEKEKAERRTQAVAREKPKPVPVHKKPTNGFTALCDDSDSEEEVSNTNVNEYPSLCQPAKVEARQQPEVKTSWAAIAAKPKPVEVPRQSGLLVLSDFMKKAPEATPVVEAKRAPWAAKDYSKPIYTKSWADWSDSEDEEEELPEVNFNQEIEDDTW
jgi:hypothetical protein